MKRESGQLARNRGKLLKAQLRLDRCLIRVLSAIETLESLELPDRERLRHGADTIEHACTGIYLDIAEANQEHELAELSRLDAQLLAWEKRQAAVEDREHKAWRERVN